MRVTIPDSHRSEVAREVIGRCHPADRFEVTVRLRRKAALPADARLTHDELAERHGARGEDVDKVYEFAAAHDLAVVQVDQGQRKVVLAGDALAMENAFGVELHEYAHAEGGSYRGHPGPVSIPAELEGLIEGVFGLDETPQAKPHFRRFTAKPVYSESHDEAGRLLAGVAMTEPAGTFTPPQLAKLYNYPAGTGAGQCIAIVELGGGWRSADLHTYFAGLGLATPSVSSVSVDHGRNAPTGNPDGPDGEVMLDIEVAGAMAPGARIVTYFAPNTDRGFMDAVGAALHDRVNKPVAISVSWGGPESNWTGAAMTQFDAILAEGAALGITITVAAGDNGSSDGVNDGKNHVDFPGSSPHVLCCGGTNTEAANGVITTQTVWGGTPDDGATGGGESTVFAAPSYQAGIALQGQAAANRLVPDVAGNADPQTGYVVRVDGGDMVVGGTSAVAPQYAALIALTAEATGKRPGFIHPTIYAAPQAFDDVTVGSNGAFSAGPGFDCCSGLGVAIGVSFVTALSGGKPN